MTFLHTSQTPGCKDLPLEGVHVSLLSHGTFWTGLHAISTERTTTLKLRNKQFAVQVGHAHPIIWNFITTVYIEQSSTDEKFLFEGNGDEPPRGKKRYVTRDRRIDHLVQSYEPNLDKLIPYLDSLRNVMIEN